MTYGPNRDNKYILNQLKQVLLLHFTNNNVPVAVDLNKRSQSERLTILNDRSVKKEHRPESALLHRWLYSLFGSSFLPFLSLLILLHLLFWCPSPPLSTFCCPLFLAIRLLISLSLSVPFHPLLPFLPPLHISVFFPLFGTASSSALDAELHERQEELYLRSVHHRTSSIFNQECICLTSALNFCVIERWKDIWPTCVCACAYMCFWLRYYMRAG